MGQQQYSLSRDARARSISSLIPIPATFLLLLAPAQADEATSPAQAQLQRVEVSARRVSEDPQAVPITISSFTGDALQRKDIRTLTDLEKNVPGLSICCNRGQSSFSFLRGIQGVQSYFAETLMLGPRDWRSAMSGSAMYFDLNNVAVLKGPQGTLFGMSTNGGALLFTPNMPQPGWSGYVGGELGDRGRRIFEAVINAPVGKQWKIRAGVQSVAVDGYVTDLSSGLKLGADHYRVGRVALSFDPSPAFDNQFVINDYRAANRLEPYVPVAVNPASAAQGIPGMAAFIERQRQLGYYRLVGLSVPASIVNADHVHQVLVANISTLRLGNGMTLKNIFGYSRRRAMSSFDADGTPFRVFDDEVPGSRPAGPMHAVSDELQLQGQALDGRLAYTAGLFHVQSHPGTPSLKISDLSDIYGIQTSSSTEARFKTAAIYGQATYKLDEILTGLKATAGYRFTCDHRWMKQSGATLDTATQTTIPNAPLDLGSSSHKASYTLGLSYQAAPRTLLYLSNSKGFLNGGFNASVTNPADAPFAPESLLNFELGLKTDFELAGMEARVNLAAYRGLYNNAQVSVTSLINEGMSTQALAVLTKNAARGRIQGLEWSFELVPNQAVALQFFGAWMKNRYTRYASLDPQGRPVDLAATPFVYVPRLKYGISATLFLPVGERFGQLEASASFTHQDEIVGTSTPMPQWYDMGPGFNNLDLNLTWQRVLGRKGLSASFFVTNALGNRDANGGFGAYESLGIVGYTPAVPRSFGLRVRQAF